MERQNVGCVYTYQRCRLQVSSSHDVSGSARIFCTSTVARYAAKPVFKAFESTPSATTARAVDCMPVDRSQLTRHFTDRRQQRAPRRVCVPSAATIRSAVWTLPSVKVIDGLVASYFCTALSILTSTPKASARLYNAVCRSARYTT